MMQESEYDHSTELAQTPQDLQDALALGFYGIQYETCLPEDIPMTPGDGEQYTDCLIRRHTDYDASKACSVTATEWTATTVCNHEEDYKVHYVELEWDNETEETLLFDLEDFSATRSESVNDIDTTTHLKTESLFDAIEEGKRTLGGMSIV